MNYCSIWKVFVTDKNKTNLMLRVRLWLEPLLSKRPLGFDLSRRKLATGDGSDLERMLGEEALVAAAVAAAAGEEAAEEQLGAAKGEIEDVEQT